VGGACCGGKCATLSIEVEADRKTNRKKGEVNR